MTIESSPTSGSGSAIERPRAILFDMTGTLHSQHDTVRASMTAYDWLLEDRPDVTQSQIMSVVPTAISLTFARFCELPFYLMRDVMTEGFSRSFELLGLTVSPERFAQFRTMASSWVDHTTLYPGTIEMLAASVTTESPPASSA